jgi:hypothetical protein
MTTSADSKGYISRAYVSNAPGACYLINAQDWGSVQPFALPTVPDTAAGGTGYIWAVVPNTGSQWKVQKPVVYALPDGVSENEYITLGPAECISPLYPGTSVTVVAFNPSTTPPVANQNIFVMNGYLFACTTGGTTAASFIGFSKFNTTKGGTTTDGTAVWTCYGKAALVRIRVTNSNSSTGEVPATQSFELIQL